MAKILLCEDDETMLSLLRTLLQIEGFQVVQMHPNDTTNEIIDLVRREQPAVVLLDVHLRQANGFDVLRELRQSEDLKSVRVLISSGMDFRTRCAEDGANDFILKPYMPDDLIAKIRRLID